MRRAGRAQPTLGFVTIFTTWTGLQQTGLMDTTLYIVHANIWLIWKVATCCFILIFKQKGKNGISSNSPKSLGLLNSCSVSMFAGLIQAAKQE